jgi:hypothetical protein
LCERAFGHNPDVEAALGNFFIKAVQLALYRTLELGHKQDYRFDRQFSGTGEHPTTAVF